VEWIGRFVEGTELMNKNVEQRVISKMSPASIAFALLQRFILGHIKKENKLDVGRKRF